LAPTRTNSRFRGFGQAGGIGLRIVLAVVTLVVLVAGVVLLVGTFQKKQQADIRHAEQISIDGLQEGLMRLQASPSWRGPVPKTAYENGWYQVTIKPVEHALHPQLTITAEGHSGSAVKSQVCLLQWGALNGADSGWILQSSKQE
jgi:hypothetical protein